MNVVVSHLVAYFGNEPENLACALFSARGALYSRSSTGGRLDGRLRAGLRAGRRRAAAQASPRRGDRGRSLRSRQGRARRGARGPGRARPRRQHAAPRTPIRSAFARGCSVRSATCSEPAFEAVRERVAREHAGLPAPKHPRPLAERAPVSSLPRVPARRRHPRPADPCPRRRARWRCATAWRSSIGCWCRRWRASLRDRAGGDQRPLLRGHRLRVPDALPPGRRHLGLPGLPGAPNDRSDGGRSGRRIPHEALRAVIVEANRGVARDPAGTTSPIARR